METESLKVEVKARAYPNPTLGLSNNTVLIKQKLQFKEFVVNESDGSVKSLGRSYSDPSLPNPPLVSLQLLNLKPDYVFHRLFEKLHDRDLSEIISDRILSESQQGGSLSIVVYVKLTQKVYTFVSGNITYEEEASKEVETGTCAICLECLSESGTETKSVCKLPNCTHLFHEDCFVTWFDRHNSCPLCRQAVEKNPTSLF